MITECILKSKGTFDFFELKMANFMEGQAPPKSPELCNTCPPLVMLNSEMYNSEAFHSALPDVGSAGI